MRARAGRRANLKTESEFRSLSFSDDSTGGLQAGAVLFITRLMEASRGTNKIAERPSISGRYFLLTVHTGGRPEDVLMI